MTGLCRAGLWPIATCSPSNFDLVLGFGAEKAFNYRSPDCAKEIRGYTRNGLAYAIDCVSESDSAQLCYGAIDGAGGRYCGVEPVRQAVSIGGSTASQARQLRLTAIQRAIIILLG